MAIRLLLPLLALFFAAPAFAQPAFIALCYHDVRDDASGDLAADRMAVGTLTLVSHFQWLKENGYTVVSLDDIEAARAGRRPLPEKAVLLTFDDGLKSLYTRVFPLLKIFRYPALASVVGNWMEAPESGWTLDYAPGRPLRRGDFVSWGELKEMQDSGLVEVATHSFDLHRGILANPQGNERPAATSLLYDPQTKSYETEKAYEIRLRSDLARAAALHRERLGRPPRAVVWPYGEYNGTAERIAREMGMTVSFGLESRPHPLSDPGAVRRFLLMDNPALPAFVRELHAWREPQLVRAVHVDLDYVYDPDPAQQERNLDLLLERIKRLRITTVYLQAFADPDGDGTASALYFPNRHLPTRADLFNRVAWQLKTRAGVAVYAWMPVLAFDLPDGALSERLSVERWEGGRRVPSREGYRRLSPYKPEARRIVGEIYDDLARNASFQGVLFHDDAFLDEREDAAGGKDGSLPSPREKTETLIRLTEELAERVREWRPAVKTARNLYARVVMEPESEGRFAQNLELSLERYDWTALMAMPYMEEANDPEGWLKALADAVARRPGGVEKTVFELQARDWRTNRPVPTAELTGWMRLLQERGAVSLGYYPDDFHNDQPELDRLRSVFSVETYPYPRR